jgi:hypothetical protein
MTRRPWTPARSRRDVVAARRQLQAVINGLLDATPGGSTPREAAIYDALFDAACHLATAAEGLDAALHNDGLWAGPKGGTP